MTDSAKRAKGTMDYVEPQHEGGNVDPDEDPASRNRSGKPPWEASTEDKVQVALVLEGGEDGSPLQALQDAGFEVTALSAERGQVLMGSDRDRILFYQVRHERDNRTAHPGSR